MSGDGGTGVVGPYPAKAGFDAAGRGLGGWRLKRYSGEGTLGEES